MYIHLGQNVVVPKKGIVGIFDMDICTSSGITRSFLIKAEKEGEVIAISGDLPKVFAVYENKGTKKVFLSQLSSQTLLKRWDTGDFEA
ncbi:MAG: DUF370 domain-containing protein [Papillibacter sp.]|jgi:hypothetical protein|nr:DUF370 domain-containing protein [Papillibacter sp.]